MKIFNTVLFLFVISEINNVSTSNSRDTKTDSDETFKNDRNIMVCRNGSKCVMKCCPVGQYVFAFKMGDERLRICDYYNEMKDVIDLENDSFGLFTHPNMSIYEIKTGVLLTDAQFRNESENVFNLSAFNVYLTEEAELYLEMPNAYDRWTKIKNDKFCWDYRIAKNKKTNVTTLEPGIWVVFDEQDDEPSRTNTVLMTTAMLISCFFLLLVLVVYSLLPELRNLCGLILMAYVASLLGGFFLLAMMRIQLHDTTICLQLSMFIYFFFLASWCWMNVMSYDIWWTFRGYAKARPIHRRGERFKFLMYCLYAWGLPLLMSIMLQQLNNREIPKYPWFVTPKIPTNGCFLEGGEKFYYLYMPMMILILCNWMFYLMTSFNIWRLSRGTAVLDSAAAGTPQAHRTHRHRFMVYLKLSVVMGLNWLLEVVSFKFPNDPLLCISDFYNVLIGVSIFLIFVCKPKILKKIIKVFMRCKKSHWHPDKKNSTRSASSSSDSSSSQETQTLQVCVNPKGPVYVMNSF